MRTIEEIEKMVNDGVLCFHHYASERGYVSAKREIEGYDYEGRFGKGYVVRYPNKYGFGGHKKSNRYYCIAYYIFK